MMLLFHILPKKKKKNESCVFFDDLSPYKISVAHINGR